MASQSDRRLVRPRAANIFPLVVATGRLDRSAFANPLSDLHAKLRRSRIGSQAVCEAIVDLLRASDDRLGRALIDIGWAADRSGVANSYHNPAHSREVGINWINLAVINNRLARERKASPMLTARELMLGCCAAFGHDLHHDGVGNTVVRSVPSGREPAYVAFRLESRAADTVGRIMARHGAARPDIARVRACILVTDVVAGYAALEAALSGSPKAPGHGVDALGLHVLRDPRTRVIAALLRDADLLCSSGLAPSDHDRTSVALEAERGQIDPWRRPAQSEGFLGAVMNGRFLSAAGARFQGNLDTIRRLNQMRLVRADLATASLAATGRMIEAGATRPPASAGLGDARP